VARKSPKQHFWLRSGLPRESTVSHFWNYQTVSTRSSENYPSTHYSVLRDPAQALRSDPRASERILRLGGGRAATGKPAKKTGRGLGRWGRDGRPMEQPPAALSFALVRPPGRLRGTKGAGAPRRSGFALPYPLPFFLSGHRRIAPTRSRWSAGPPRGRPRPLAAPPLPASRRLSSFIPAWPPPTGPTAPPSGPPSAPPKRPGSSPCLAPMPAPAHSGRSAPAPPRTEHLHRRLLDLL
jgi:hypothetical protein